MDVCYCRSPSLISSLIGNHKLRTEISTTLLDESDFVNNCKGNGFILRDSSDWELDSTISLELTDLLDDISIFLGGTEVGGQRSLSQKFQFRYWNLGRKKKQQQKANRGMGIIVSQNNQSSQTSILGKRRRRTVRKKTLKCKQITAEIKTGKQQRCY